ncbi:MAG: AraC family ligand binding domain-containing protein, partial [Planctomycetes bacterium]|nr:AraC family ligand binding domain-containing protein [Planctomycetota bacterium]
MASRYDLGACSGPYCPYIHAADDTPRMRPWALPRRRLTHYLLVVSLDGAERIVVDGRAWVVPPGTGYLIQPGALADLGSADGNRPVWVHFDVVYDARRDQHPVAGAYAAELGERAPFLQPDARATWGVDLPVLVEAALHPLLRQRLPRLVAAWRQGGPVADLVANHELAGLLVAMVERATSGGSSGDDAPARLARAERAALRALDCDFGVSEFAAAAGLSRSRFSAVFAAARGMGPAA